MASKKYFREAPEEEIRQLIKDKRTIDYLMECYKQPEWCGYHNALNGKMGCWSLMDIYGRRAKISEEYCKKCEYFEQDESVNKC